MLDVELWKKRQNLHYRVRDFFLKRNLLEVDVPMLSAACGTDPQLDYFETLNSTRYLATSPEFFMKRLLVGGFGDIFSLTHAFRKGESGDRHNSEFNIAEWYRIGASAEDLQLEILDLVNEITGLDLTLKRTTWEQAFEKVALKELKAQHKDWSLEEIEDYAMSCIIEPNLGKNCAEFIVDYPPERAALAKIRKSSNGREVACRFELYINGIEICNGYQELVNAQEQRKRFLEDMEKRKKMGKTVPKIDNNFLEALRRGMPECSGVALGLDRLYMIALEKSNIEEVLLFADSEA
ncbi:MAG: EF-P lysine aminoacylase GenX [Fibromonadaceae bacterium]|jgi:lysyl-tRNA synthetase class 2|nr:EF-P lysine aminoacylase GenX [Fibromonadaceae bacterium]